MLVDEGLRVERARDLFADTVAACAKRKSCPANPTAYFWRTLKNIFNRYLRDEKDRTEPLVEDPPARDPTPLERVWDRELWEKVEEKLATLPERPAEVARLHLRAGLSLAAIGRKLGLAPSTVRSHWAAARGALRELVDRLGL